MPHKLPLEFYLRDNVVQIARELLGKVLVTQFDGQYTAGKITETEAYRAPEDRASHAWGNRNTERTWVMFEEGGRAYVYLCYGIHHLFNVVTGPKGSAHAVLVRAVEPLEGLEIMAWRRFGEKAGLGDLKKGFFSALSLPEDPQQWAASLSLKQKVQMTVGPGALGQALGLTTAWTNQSLVAPDSLIWIEDRGFEVAENDIATGKRIGVDYAGPDAELPWRFWLKNSPFAKLK